MTAPFIGSVFIATSTDGFIARTDGSLDWLTDRDPPGDTGYDEFMAGVDALVMGRGTYDTVRGFDEWPYAGRRTFVLSTTLPDDDDRVQVHRSLDALVAAVTASGATHVYVDGGQVIQAFLRAGLIAELTLTRVPVLLGEGIPLFGPTGRDVALVHRRTRVLEAGLVQSVYDVDPRSRRSSAEA